MRRWIVFGCGAIALGAAAWYFGKPAKRPASPPAPAPVAVAPAEASKEAPAKVIEVIDLARAYEPVPEPEEFAPGGVDPATFIPVADAPARIPYATDESHLLGNLLAAIRRTPLGAALFGRAASEPERIDIMPRSILDVYGGGSVPVRVGTVQIEGSILPVIETLNVMPREVRPLFPQEERERDLTPREVEQLGVNNPG